MTRLVPEASRLQSHAEEIAKRGTEKTEQDQAFDAWLRNTPNARRAIAESKHPDLMEAAMRLAFAVGYQRGFKEGAESTAKFAVAIRGR